MVVLCYIDGVPLMPLHIGTKALESLDMWDFCDIIYLFSREKPSTHSPFLRTWGFYRQGVLKKGIVIVFIPCYAKNGFIFFPQEITFEFYIC